MAPDSGTTKSIILKTSWKQYFIPYLLSGLAIPLFGIGLIALYYVRKKHLSSTFEVTDTGITLTDSGTRHHVDLSDINEIGIRQNWLQKKLGIGTLRLRTSASGIELPGMQQPERLKSTIEQAVAHQKRPVERQSFRERPDPDFRPGAMEKMDYLTGLWQQGLLSEEDFDNEKKNFE